MNVHDVVVCCGVYTVLWLLNVAQAAGDFAAETFICQESCEADGSMSWRSMPAGSQVHGAALLQTPLTQKMPLATATAAHAEPSLHAGQRVESGVAKPTDAAIHHVPHVAPPHRGTTQQVAALLQQQPDMRGPSVVACLLVLMSVPALVCVCTSGVLMYSFVQDKREQAELSTGQPSKREKGPHQYYSRSSSMPSLSDASTKASTVPWPSHFKGAGASQGGTPSSSSSFSSAHHADDVSLPPSLPLARPPR